MTPLLLALLVSVGSLAVLVAGQRRLTPAALMVVSAALVLVGFAVLVERSGAPAGTWAVFAALPAFAAGVLLRERRRGRDTYTLASPWLPTAGLAATAVVVTGMTVVHFAVAGVPALMGTAETSRFALGASGLGGVPSRCALFGLPALALVTAVRAAATPRWLLVLVWGTFVASRLGMGFKGGLLEVLILAVTVAMLRGSVLRARTLAAVVVLTTSAVGYAVWIGSRYATLARSGGVSASYVGDRMTVQAAEPAWHLLHSGPLLTGGQSVARHDLAYFLERYVGLGDGPSFAVDQLVSSMVTGTARSADSFLVPVTTGGPAYLVLSVGAVLAVVALVALGWAWSWACARLSGTAGFAATVVAAMVLLGMRSFVLNGGGVYIGVNYAFTLLLLLAPYTAVVLLRSAVLRPAVAPRAPVRRRPVLA